MAGKWFNSQAKLILNTDKKVNHVANLLTLIKTINIKLTHGILPDT